jgi:hypothetical protein
MNLKDLLFITTKIIGAIAAVCSGMVLSGVALVIVSAVMGGGFWEPGGEYIAMVMTFLLVCASLIFLFGSVVSRYLLKRTEPNVKIDLLVISIFTALVTATILIFLF